MINKCPYFRDFHPGDVFEVYLTQKRGYNPTHLVVTHFDGVNVNFAFNLYHGDKVSVLSAEYVKDPLVRNHIVRIVNSQGNIGFIIRTMFMYFRKVQ